MSASQSYDLYSQDFSRHAYEIFKTIRQTQPILQQPGFDGHTPIWFISRYEDVDALLHDDRHFTLDYRLAIDLESIPAERRQSDIMDMLNNHLWSRPSFHLRDI